MLKSLLLSTALVGAMISAAAAADVVVEEPVMYNWSGAYIGAFAGGGWGDVNVTDVDGYNGAGGVGDFSYDTGGFFGGLYGGYNWQFNQIVAGVEVELGYLGLDDSEQYPDFVGVRGPDDSRASIDSDFFVSATARLGYAFDNILVYGKGGYAGLNTDVSFIDTDPTGATLISGTSESDFLSGYTVGGGVEVGFTPNLRGKIEYMFADFGDVSHTATSDFGPDFEFNHEVDEVHTVKVGLSYAF